MKPALNSVTQWLHQKTPTESLRACFRQRIIFRALIHSYPESFSTRDVTVEKAGKYSCFENKENRGPFSRFFVGWLGFLCILLPSILLLLLRVNNKTVGKAVKKLKKVIWSHCSLGFHYKFAGEERRHWFSWKPWRKSNFLNFVCFFFVGKRRRSSDEYWNGIF